DAGRLELPALATTQSSRPSSRAASTIASRTRSSSVTSTVCVKTRRPYCRRSSAACSFFSVRRPQRTTSAPAFAIPRANPSPSPALPPVTRPTFPVKSNASNGTRRSAGRRHALFEPFLVREHVLRTRRLDAEHGAEGLTAHDDERDQRDQLDEFVVREA